jgi:hypothetical protein
MAIGQHFYLCHHFMIAAMLQIPGGDVAGIIEEADAGSKVTLACSCLPST